MSWFARSIANTFQLDDNNLSTDEKLAPEVNSPSSPTRGVKEDLSDLTKTLTTSLWGVASFLAPPPPAEHSYQQQDPFTPLDPESAAPETRSGIRRDFAEIGGRFRSGISKVYTNIDVSEITKLASSILQLSPEAVGVTDEVLAFVTDVTMRPETWMEFPMLEDADDGEGEEFELSDAQQDHALAVERLVPRLAALRIELCPGYMSESSFWKIYFVLLHPRLEPHAAELLSTPEIVKARELLTHELEARSSVQTQGMHSSVPSGIQLETVPLEASTTPLTAPDVSADTEKTEKQPVPTEEIQIVDKSVIQEELRNETKTTSSVVEDKDEDDWLKEDGSEHVNITGKAAIPIENDEDVSFSDLEDDDDGDKHQKTTSTKDSRDWVDVDDIDVA